MRDSYRLFIPTRDSANWIGMVLDFYLSRGVSPLVVVDSRTADCTREVVASKGISYLEFAPRGDYPEAGMLQFAAEHANADWIFRLDDDELPSQKLIDFVIKRGVNSKNQCWFIERRELYWEKGRIVFSRSPGKYPLPDNPASLQPMARLFHVDRVEYLEEVHTTGLRELKLYGFAPPEAFCVHLNCLVHNFDMRINKVLDYEQIKPGLTWELADEYLPELFDDKYHNSSGEGLEEFREIFSQLYDYAGINPGQLARINIDLLQNAVAARNKKLIDARRLSRGKLLNADDAAWIEYFPKSIRLPVAKLLCTLPSKRIRRVGLALWDYIELHQKSVS